MAEPVAESGWETPCPSRADGHCEHWYDGHACCACGDPADLDALAEAGDGCEAGDCTCGVVGAGGG